MNRLLAALILLPAMAFGQVRVDIDVKLPDIVFTTPPPLVVVQPGVQVVEDYDEDLYVVDDAYWVRRDGRWFRARDYRGGWVVVEERRVPVTVVKLPPGRYKRWKHGKKAAVPASYRERGPDDRRHDHDDHHDDHHKGGKGKGKR
ncbi:MULTISPECIES: hypothetical protein [unclassified Corallococcus]|uniref:hypothetical protein n=1 Tax=unclassified Corallococcus TaxID=2685029 RepID=UPI001A8E69AC|nr:MULTISPECIES: hypothetical protein [unclassified Corallococcus]MBN9686187.1 hypothetical protein [Corallococcus sp. NCSPR001]WAS82381.1 hypothetical protein O0N60_23985 [Corallococcus sp. NCRR]